MATAAASRPSGPVLLSPFPNYQSASLSRVKLSAGGSPVKSISALSPPSSPSAATKIRRSCMCSPTNHPGSFRCSLHKERKQDAVPAVSSKQASPPSPPPIGSGRSRRMVNVLAQRVPMGSGHWARRALAPSPSVQQLQQRKRADRFRAGPSRLSGVSMAGRRAGGSQ
ncbi:hypothetical protein CFC21_089876 [Triticum aestivum]|uniref:Serine-rich protein n=3 Tax=Triticum TaxID=4564 RepID=A0A9R1BF55_TRITD|nr:uncharacterized protein LOC119326121 [Triticum dicoccoides]XP_044409956.1 uncharacterized protein LOC123134866 [Triticum aestivum]KAF7086591.1 hypothetical protein CFC21_089876 [Triticum aestivum]VAI62372.1 unnamed protein product [Triticum turgidum subsp. durum]